MEKNNNEENSIQKNDGENEQRNSVRGEVLGSALLMIGSLIPGVRSLSVISSWLTGLSSHFGTDPLIKQIENLVNQRLTENAVNQAQAQLNGLARNIQEYERALERWKANKNPSTVGAVVSYYRILVTHFNTTLAAFKQQNMDVTLLPMYAQAACSHLLFLREASIYGPEWRLASDTSNRGMDPSEVDYYYQEQMKHTNEHIDYCVSIYKKGLDQLRGQHGVSVNRWIEFNQLRRNLTISVLDLLPLFSTFDLKKYPTTVSSQLTREVYTDPYLDLNSRNNATGLSFGVMESVLRVPHLSDILQNFTVFTDEYTQQRGRYWSGHRMNSRLIGSSADSNQNLGIVGTTEQSRVFTIAQNNLIQVRQNHFYNERRTTGGITQPGRTFSYRGISGVSFLQSNSARPIYREAANQVDDSLNQLPPTNINATTTTYSHKVSNIRFVRSPDASTQTNNFSRLPLFCWVHASLAPENIVFNNAITQLSIAKMNQLDAGATMVENPGFCGGDIVRRETNGGFGRFTVNNNTGGSLSYRVRIRYASTSPVRFHINLGGNVNQADFPATMSRGSNLTHSTFETRSYTTPYTMREGIQDLQVSTMNALSINSVYIDKIEIVPVALGVAIMEEKEE